MSGEQLCPVARLSGRTSAHGPGGGEQDVCGLWRGSASLLLPVVLSARWDRVPPVFKTPGRAVFIPIGCVSFDTFALNAKGPQTGPRSTLDARFERERRLKLDPTGLDKRGVHGIVTKLDLSITTRRRHTSTHRPRTVARCDLSYNIISGAGSGSQGWAQVQSAFSQPRPASRLQCTSCHRAPRDSRLTRRSLLGSVARGRAALRTPPPLPRRVRTGRRHICGRRGVLWR